MGLKDNIYYWKESLKNPEPVIDEYYTCNEVIILNNELINNVNSLRKLISDYCDFFNDKKKSQEVQDILNKIYEIVNSENNIQYTEFVAFWKTLDISYSVFKNMSNNKIILEEILKKYCKKRQNLYKKYSYSNVTIQALYDNGVSRKHGFSGIDKLKKIVSNIIMNIEEVKNIDEFEKFKNVYFLPDKNKSLFKDFYEKYKIEYKFKENHQNKIPDFILIINNRIFVIEAKHIKESGGAQDKQINELIEFIKYSENWDNIHYVSFMDGVYFNQFIYNKNSKSNKINAQIKEIENNLKKQKNNFFLNTYGMSLLIKDVLNIN